MTKSALAAAATGADEEPIAGTQSGPDAEKGKLFDLPRVAIVTDETDPTTLKIAFAGSVELDRSIPDDVSFYNRLIAGQDGELRVTVHVAGAKTTHHRDSEGYVDDVIQTKSLIVHSVEAV